jgi:uncharacterized protein (TIGR03118 family)
MSAAPVFTTTNLASNLASLVKTPDADLQNPWGVSFAPNGVFWVSDNNASKATLYDGNGVKQKLVVNIPGANGVPGNPTGQLFNSTGQFNVEKGGTAASPLFIFASEDGTIAGWSPKLDANNAITAVNHTKNSVFKGIAMGQVKGENELFVANFRAGTVDVFGPNFAQIHRRGAFVDSRVPKGFAPFNVQNIGGNLYVTYAKQNRALHDDVAGPGNGFVDVFNTKGQLIRRLQHGSWLNSPWGLTVAPPSFGTFAGDLLVGNFGSGVIDIYNQKGNFVGFLDGADGKPIHEDGLWALTIGSGGSTESTNKVYFTAGLNHEQDGLFGSIQISAV